MIVWGTALALQVFARWFGLAFRALLVLHPGLLVLAPPQWIELQRLWLTVRGLMQGQLRFHHVRLFRHSM
jgi:hypothetical protein